MAFAAPALRPPPPRDHRGRWRFAIGAGVLIVAASIPASFLWLRNRRDVPPRWNVTSERFVEALALGGGLDATGRPGLFTAYELLSEAKRATLPYDVFFEEWTRLFDERGFIVERFRAGDKRARGRVHDPIVHLLFLGGEQDDHARLSTVEITLTMERSGEKVADYATRFVPNPRAAR